MFPDDLIPRATQILLPRWLTPDERSAWLAQAFFLAEPRLYNDLRALDGQPIIILTNTITALLEAGCLPNKKAHTLAQLLTSVRIIASPEVQTEIDRLVPLLNNACAESKPSTSTGTTNTIANQTPSRPDKPLQSYETPLDERTPTVFISYSHSDDSFAVRLINDLQDGGHSVWIDKMNIKGGAEWVRSIADGISNSYAFVSVLSPEANISRWVQREYLYADNLGKPIFPVMAKTSEVPFQMIDRQVLSLVNDYLTGLADLLTALPAPRVVTLTPEMIQPSPPPPPMTVPLPTPVVSPIPRPGRPITPKPQAPEAIEKEAADEQLKASRDRGGEAEETRDWLHESDNRSVQNEVDDSFGGMVEAGIGADDEAAPDLDDFLSIPAPIPRAKPIARAVGGKVANTVDRRALELMYINRVAAERIDAMAEMDAPTPDDRVRVMRLGERGFTISASDWATVERQLPDSGGATALSMRRVILMGDDLQDSMSAVWAAAATLTQRAMLDPTQPIPLVIDATRWPDGVALDGFIESEMGELGAHLDDLLRDKRAALIFDGLYGLTPERMALVESFINGHPDLMAVVNLTAAE